MFFLKKLFGDENSRALARITPLVEKINALEAEVAALPKEEFPARTNALRERLLSGEGLDALLPEAFALVREAAKRTLGQRHFDVQLIGGIALHQGNIAEMRTGEGKTLVATLPAYLNALTGKGVHVVTVNDYLSRRDAVWMGQVYAYLGLTTGILNHEASFLYDPAHTNADKERDELGSFKVVHEFLRPVTRKEAYAADITYGTNNEYGFDYLRDNLEYDPKNLRQRSHHYAIIDEIDSILIDEARTPLIISAPSGDSEDLYARFAQIARGLEAGRDYQVDEKLRAIELTDEGIERAEKSLGIDNIYTEKGIKYVHHLETAVRAKALFEKDKEYVVKDGEVVIVDEFTGRLQPGRRWSEGLHQAVEAKEGVEVKKESRTFASVTFQNYFRAYEKLGGMTGTAKTSAEEFYTVYKLETMEIPTHRSIQRKDHNDLIFQTENGKFKAVARKVKELHSKGQPVLLGTVSIEKNELLSAYLKQEGIPHEMLNAKNHEREGEIIAQAGEKGKVTLATNMAGRGVDIKLGGVPGSQEAYDEVKAIGGLYVIGTERHEARRIDNQLRGRAGRQGDPGETQFFVSLEDSLMRVFASDTVKNLMGRFGIPEDEPVENGIITRSLESAQKKIEGFNFDTRKHVLAYDNVLNQQRKTIYDRRVRILMSSNADGVEEVLRELIGDDTQALETLTAKRKELGEERFHASLRLFLLQTIDLLWVEHLEAMDYLRSSVRLRAYGQRDPLIEYRKEGLRLFQDMENALTERVLHYLPNVGMIAGREEVALRETREGAQALSSAVTLPAEAKKVGRNEMVTITDGTETQTLKFKKAEALLASGKWKVVE